MRTIVILAIASGLVSTVPAMAMPARPHGHLRQSNSTMTRIGAEIVARSSAGLPTKVKVAGQVYDICSATISDGCINPRQAGLNFGNAPLTTWPGHPASQAN